MQNALSDSIFIDKQPSVYTLWDNALNLNKLSLDVIWPVWSKNQCSGFEDFHLLFTIMMLAMVIWASASGGRRQSGVIVMHMANGRLLSYLLGHTTAILNWRPINNDQDRNHSLATFRRTAQSNIRRPRTTHARTDDKKRTTLKPLLPENRLY